MVRYIPAAQLYAALPGAVIGGVALVVCLGVGWWVAGRPVGWLVRGASYWLDHVVRRVLDGRSWAMRAAIIAANNSLVCVLLVVLGSMGHAAWLGIAGVGLGLGTALRVAMDRGLVFFPEGELSGRQRVAVGVGITLNLLEPPAILLAAGLSLGQGAVVDRLGLTTALQLYGGIGLPMLMIAAGGEALWLGVSEVRFTSPGQCTDAEVPSPSEEEPADGPE